MFTFLAWGFNTNTIWRTAFASFCFQPLTGTGFLPWTVEFPDCTAFWRILPLTLTQSFTCSQDAKNLTGTDKTSEIIPRGICVGNPSYSSKIMVGKLLQCTKTPTFIHEPPAQKHASKNNWGMAFGLSSTGECSWGTGTSFCVKSQGSCSWGLGFNWAVIKTLVGLGDIGGCSSQLYGD